MIGRSKCRHRWKLVGVKYNPPLDGMTSAKGNSEALLREVLYGVTILTQQCTSCGWIATSHAFGQVDVSTAKSDEMLGVDS